MYDLDPAIWKPRFRAARVPRPSDLLVLGNRFPLILPQHTQVANYGARCKV